MMRGWRTGLAALALSAMACGTLQISFESTATPDLRAAATVAALQTQNAAQATQIEALRQVTPLPSAAVPVPTTAPSSPAQPPATRISFLQDATVGVVSAPIEAGQVQNYVLDAFQGQPMFVYLSSMNNDVTLSIRSDTGATLVNSAARKMSWQGTLPQTGNYFISVHGGAATDNFTLTVTIPLRLQFPQGADAATVTGRTVVGYDVSYAVFAGKGQVMSVDLTDLSGKASLSVYGFTDGQRYVASQNGQKNLELVLPSRQDYIIVVVPFQGNVVNYTMTVTIR